MTNDKRDEFLFDHGKQIATHVQQIDSIKADLVRVEGGLADLSKACQASNDKLKDRLWDLAKLLIAAILGASLTRGCDLLLKRSDLPPQPAVGREKR